MFFIPGIFGSPGALSSAGGEGFFVRSVPALLLLLLGGCFLAVPPATADVVTPGDSRPTVEVSPDSIRYIFPPFLVEEERWNPREARSELLMTVIGPERLNATSAMGLGEVLTRSAGVYLRRSGGPGSPSFLTIRGASAQQVLVLLNGRKLNTGQGGGVDLSTLSPWEVDRIEIYREANSARWSGESIGGVLNIVTSEREDDRVHVRTLGGSRGARSLAVGAGFGGRLRFDGSAQVRAGSGDFEFEDPRRGNARRRVNAGFRGRSFSGTLEGAAGGERSFRIHVAGGGERRGAPGPIEFPTAEAQLDDDRFILQGTVSDSAGLFRWTVGSGLHRLDRRYRNPDPVLWADDRHVNTGVSFTADAARVVGPARIEGGGVLEEDALRSTTDGRRRRNRSAVWLRAGFGIGRTEESGGSRASLTPGIRVERTTGYAARPLPSLSGRLSLLGDRMVLRGSVGRKYRAPSFDELFWPLSSGSQGNPDLRPERSAGVEVSGTAYLLHRRLRLRATGFRRKVTDLIEWAPGAQGIWRPHNVGAALERGVELEAAWSGRIWRRLPPVSGEMSHSLLQATDEGDDPSTRGARLVRRPVSMSTASLEIFPARRVTTGVSWTRVGRRYLTRANTKWTDPYNVLDLHVNLSAWAGGSLHLAVENLLDRSYYDMDDFPVPGRTLSAALDVSLR